MGFRQKVLEKRLNQKALIRVKISPLKGISSGRIKSKSTNAIARNHRARHVVDITRTLPCESGRSSAPATMTSFSAQSALLMGLLIVRQIPKNRPTTKYLLQRYYFEQAEEGAAEGRALSSSDSTGNSAVMTVRNLFCDCQTYAKTTRSALAAFFNARITEGLWNVLGAIPIPSSVTEITASVSSIDTVMAHGLHH